MIEGGCLIMLASIAMMFVPTPSPLPGRRTVRSFGCGIALRTAFPTGVAGPAFANLVTLADEAIERDALMRGVRGVTATYDQA